MASILWRPSAIPVAEYITRYWAIKCEYLVRVSSNGDGVQVLIWTSLQKYTSPICAAKHKTV